MNLFIQTFLKNKIEEKTGVDLNRDGRIGGGGLTGAAKNAPHIHLNRDGVIGRRPTSARGGNLYILNDQSIFFT